MEHPTINKAVVSILNTFTGLKLKVKRKGEKTDMCKAWEDHRNSGKIEGKIEGKNEERELLNKLNAILLEHKRYDDLKRSTEDKDFQTELINELVLNITD